MPHDREVCLNAEHPFSSQARTSIISHILFIFTVFPPQVIIITNSDEGWVRYSAERFVPKLLPVVDKYRIVSARTRYEKFYPGQPLCWKAAAFAHEVNELYETQSSASDNASQKSYDSLELTDVSSASEDSLSPQQSPVVTPPCSKREVISFGDSMEERTAVRIVSEQLCAIPKSVMFLQSPTPVQIIGQLLMLTEHMKYVCDHETSLDLEISLEQAERCASQFIKRNDICVDSSSFPGTGKQIEQGQEQPPSEVVVTAAL